MTVPVIAGFVTVNVAAGGGGGSGDVVGPSSATDNAIVRFDSITGKLVQNSLATVDDSGGGAFTTLSASGVTILGVVDSGGGAVQQLQFSNSSGTQIIKAWTPGFAYLPLNLVGSLIDLNAVSGIISLNAGTVNLVTPAANTLALRNGGAAQELQLHGTYTDASNYERLALKLASGLTFQIIAQAAGTGVVRHLGLYGNGVYIGGDGGLNDHWLINSSGHFVSQGVYNITTTGTVTIGGGTAIAKVLSAAATLNFGSILAAASADLTITVTGAAVGDAVDLGCPAAPDASIVYNAFVSAADTVTVRAFNVGAIADDPASATYRVAVLHF